MRFVPLVINNVNYSKKIFKITALIILSTSIYACSQPKDKKIIQQSEKKQTQIPLAITNKIKAPTWNNIKIKTISGHDNTIWSVVINQKKINCYC